MGKIDKLLWRILSGRADADISFQELLGLLRHLGFEERIRGDHHIFTRHDLMEILNLQPVGHQAKPYQVKQVRNLLLKYPLGVIHDEPL
ncbi:MAG: type II toxin-antitoxin system HicA family toxin [Magnetococcales bacterium]|nr:type II toxin-antitoxin system HicA family toxin [Magnetococcales bacterium]